MNIFRTFACRAFQTAFYLGSALLPFREPTPLEGYGELSAKIKQLGLKKPLIVTDQGIFGLKLHCRLTEALDKEGIPYALYADVVANPTFACVEEGFGVYREQGCDCVIGLGGGSSMDAAKAILIKVAYPDKSLQKFKGLLHVHRKLPTLFAIPTTAGTGSETTVAAIVVNEKTKDKFQIDDTKLIPSYAVFDPELLLGLPPKIIASTGMDALTHAVEAYIGRSNTKGTKKAALEAVSLIDQYLLAFHQDRNVENARMMQRASYLAGVAFTRAYVGYVHALAHALGGTYNVAHGYANAVLLPYVLEDFGSSAHKKLAELYDRLGEAGSSLSVEEKAKAFIAYVKGLNAKLGIDEAFVGIVKEEDFEALARHADKEGNPLYPVPKEFNAKELEKTLRRACR